MNRETWESLNAEQQAIIRAYCELLEDTSLQAILAEQLAADKELLPHIKAIMKKRRKDPEFQNITIYDVLDAQSEANARNLGGLKNEPKSKAFLVLEEALRRKAIPLQPNHKIKTHSEANNLLINYMQDNSIIGTKQNEKPFDLPVIPARNITAYTSIAFDEESTKSGIYAGIENITEQDRRVIGIMYDLWKEADKSGTPCLINGEIIAANMPGGAGNKITAKEAERFNDIIEKLRHLFIYIDATDEMRARAKARGDELPDDYKFILDDYCISALGGKEYRTRSGQVKKCFELHAVPLPIRYAEETKQIISISADLYDVQQTITGSNGELKILNKYVSMTERKQSIVSYLLRRIHLMIYDYKKAKDALRKHNDRQKKKAGKGHELQEHKTISDFREIKSDIIKLSAVYEKCGLLDPTRTEAQRCRETCKEALDFWKAKGLINDYEIKTGKDAFIKISLDE